MIAVCRAIAVVALALLAASIARYRSDCSGREAGQRFLAEFDVVARRPADAATLPLAPAADLASNIVADIALNDALGIVRLSDVSFEKRERWLRAAERTDDELSAARDLTLDAIVVRPGWAHHWSMLGRLVYIAQRRRPLDLHPLDMALWQTAFRIATIEGPGDDASASFAAGAYLETWPLLSPSMRAAATGVFRRALVDPAFSTRAFPLILETVGHEGALALLPEEPATLRAAFDALAATGDISAATSTWRRWEQAEWHDREVGLREIEERTRLDDVEKLRELSSYWISRHPPSDFDTPAGRKQVIRVLQLAVNDRTGMWQSDPRGIAVRYLLNRRLSVGSKTDQSLEITPGGAAINSAVASLDGVPDPMRSRARLLAGDIYGAESLFQRSDTAGSFEWTQFLIDLAEYRLTQNTIDEASALLETIAPAARNECDVLIERRKVARQRKAKSVEDDINRRLIQPEAIPSQAWSSNGALSLCIDPDLAGERLLATTLEAEGPALIAWGWNDGRQGSVVLPAGRTILRVPLASLSGRNSFFVHTLAGKVVKPVETRVEPH